VTVTPAPGDIVIERDVVVPMRDGVTLRANVFRPTEEGRHPVLVALHPYGKDDIPANHRGGNRAPRQYRVMPQSVPFTHSALTGWEGPDPAYWVAQGYVVVNVDQRGWGRSEGVGELLSEKEGLDGHDVVEWAAIQPWSSGRVGMTGVSYLAVVQWATAAQRPPHLGAICPWEGFTDFYRDFARPGGIREDGFLLVWVTALRLQRRSPVPLRRQQKARSRRDDWWRARARDIENIEVPALVCGSFSDHNLHSGGSFEGFRRIGSQQKWLYTHRGPKWATYYSTGALERQRRFFDHFLRGEDNGWPSEPRVRVEVREDATTVTSVYGAEEWPVPTTTWRTLHLDADLAGGPGPERALRSEAVPTDGSATFDARRGHSSFGFTFDQDTEISGPMSLRLHLEVSGADDVHLFVGVEKRRDGHRVGFEGSYGFDADLVTHGMLRASLRRVDQDLSTPWQPAHPFTDLDPLHEGQVVAVDIGLLPSATLFRRGERLVLDIRGRWFFSRLPVIGQFPAAYQRSPKGRCTLHTGGSHDATLIIPVIPDRELTDTLGRGT
jgi:uncharacterized protein